MVIAIYGAGYVGLVSAACFAKMGHQVICADVNKDRISTLNNGECPIYEDQLPQLLKEQLLQGCLQFTADLSYAIKQATVHVIATGTPSMPDGSTDLSQVFAVATQIAREVDTNCLLVTKSTVPVGTGDAIQALVNEELERSGKPYHIAVASNPEFLREGNAVYDFLHADRIIIGGEVQAIAVLKTIYQPLVEQNIPLLTMSRRSAELTKYAANAMLACKISFINQMSQISEKVGANIDDIRLGIGSDKRIGSRFLRAGIGFGGSCFPKDGRSLIQTAQSLNIDVPLLSAIEMVNRMQKSWVIEQLNNHFKHTLQNKVIGIWGLAFKPDTDDMREASSLAIIDSLLQSGAKLRLYDPVAMAAARAYVPEHQSITWCDSAESVLMGNLDALVIATEWQLFQEYSLPSLQSALRDAPIIDGRNCFDLALVEKAAISYYYSVGRPVVRQTLTGRQYTKQGVF